MNTDPISDLLTRIRNAHMRGKSSVVIPYSKIKSQIAEILQANKFISEQKTVKNDQFQEIEVTLNPEIRKLSLNRVSKPGQRIYVKSNELKTIKSGLGIGIISTSKGMMTTKDAKTQGLGGELICEVY